MKHIFKINKLKDFWYLGELDNNNKINGLGMIHIPKTNGFVIGKFIDSKPSGVYVSDCMLQYKKKKYAGVCIETDPTKKYPGCFKMVIVNDTIYIRVFEDGNKETKNPFTVVIKENCWSVTKKGNTKSDIFYMVDKERRYLTRSSNKKGSEDEIKVLEWVNLDPILWNLSVPTFPTGIQFEDKRKTLKANGIGPCFEYTRSDKKLYFIENGENEGLSWYETGKEHKGIIDISQYEEDKFKGYITIDKATNIITIHNSNYDTYGKEWIEMTVDPTSCTFEIKHPNPKGKDKAIVDKDAKATYWSNCRYANEKKFDFEETF